MPICIQAIGMPDVMDTHTYPTCGSIIALRRDLVPVCDQKNGKYTFYYLDLNASITVECGGIVDRCPIPANVRGLVEEMGERARAMK